MPTAVQQPARGMPCCEASCSLAGWSALEASSLVCKLLLLLCNIELELCPVAATFCMCEARPTSPVCVGCREHVYAPAEQLTSLLPLSRADSQRACSAAARAAPAVPAAQAREQTGGRPPEQEDATQPVLGAAAPAAGAGRGRHRRRSALANLAAAAAAGRHGSAFGALAHVAGSGSRELAGRPDTGTRPAAAAQAAVLEGSHFYAVSEGEVNDAALAAHLAAAMPEGGALDPGPAGSAGEGDEAARLAAFMEALEGLGTAGEGAPSGAPAGPRRAGGHQAARGPSRAGARGAGAGVAGRRGFAALASACGGGAESSSDDSSEDEADDSAGASGGVRGFTGFVAARSRGRARTAARSSGTAPARGPGSADGLVHGGERAHDDALRPASQPRTADLGDSEGADAIVTAQPLAEPGARDWGDLEGDEARSSPAGAARPPGKADALAVLGARTDGVASTSAAAALATRAAHELRHPPRAHWAPEGSEAAQALALLAATEAKYAGLGGVAERAAVPAPAPVPVSEQRLLQVRIPACAPCPAQARGVT